jgi:hypothetical protein
MGRRKNRQRPVAADQRPSTNGQARGSNRASGKVDKINSKATLIDAKAGKKLASAKARWSLVALIVVAVGAYMALKGTLPTINLGGGMDWIKGIFTGGKE